MISDKLFAKRLNELKARKIALISEGEQVRHRLEKTFQPVIQGMHIADQVIDAGKKTARFMRMHPLLVGVAVAAAFRFSPKRLFSFGMAGYGLIQKGRRWHTIAQVVAKNASRLLM